MQRSAGLHLPLRSVLDRSTEVAVPYERVDTPPEDDSKFEPSSVRPSIWLTDEDLTPEERALRLRARRRRWIALGVLAVFLVVGLIYARPMGRAVKGWQARRLAREAETLLAGKEWQAAYPLLRDAIKLSFNDPMVTRLMAEFQSRAGTPEAVAWWVRLTELEPGVAAHQIRLTHAAVREREMEMAEQSLAKVPAAARQSAAYYEAAAAVAIARGNYPAAAEILARWQALDPGSEFAKLNIAILRLHAKEPAQVEAARGTLRELTRNAQVGRAATRALVTEALQRGDFEGASALARPLAVAPDGEFEDRILELDVLARASDPNSGVRVKEAQEAAGEDPARIVLLARWLFVQRRFSEAFGWLRTLPESLRLRPPVAITVADATMSIKDWSGLANVLRSQEWGSSEFLRLAFLARAAREQDRMEAANSWWRRALEQATDPVPQAALLRLVNSWGWKKEAEEVLWAMRVANPTDLLPLETLERVYAGSGNTRGLLRTAQDRLARDPKSSRARNDIAALSLLLRENLVEAHIVADELGKEQPNDPVVQSTLAYSLLVRGRPDEALAVFRRIPEAARQRPSIAAYYGAVLCATGQPELAEFYFGVAERAAKLLPEEQALVAASRQLPKATKK